MTTYYLKLMNISSGDAIFLTSDSLTKFGWNKNMNWETSLVVGRMDPIQNFRNTESKVDIGIEVSNIKVYKEVGVEDFFTFESDPNFSSKNVNLDSYSSPDFKGFFYPSYQQDGNSYSIKTAPVFRCQLYIKLAAGKKNYFLGYATIPSFQYSKTKYVDENGRSYNTGLDFTLNVIHTKITSVSSKILGD